MSLAKLTAPQDLMMDLLVARTRLGEPFWPVSTKLTRTYHELSAKGYVTILSGHVEGTVRLMLTDAARKELIEKASYTPRIQRDIASHIADSLEMSGADPTTVRMIRRQFVEV